MKEKAFDKRLMKEILNILKERSQKSLALASKELLAINVESKKGRQALKRYAANWDDVTHPGILSLACDAVGGKPDEALQMQVILLLLTAAIDIHDDIIDQTRIKKKKPTIFGIFGKDVALLLGDAILMRSFILLCKYGQGLSLETMNLIVDAIQNTFFQVGDAHLLEAEIKGKLNVTPSRYAYIIEKKASNIEAITRIGAIIGKGSKKEIDALGTCGKILGELITLREEFIDIFEPEELSNRMKNECLPLPILYAIQSPSTRAIILNTLSAEELSASTTKEIVKIVFKSKNVKKLRTKMQRLAQEALDIIYKLPLKHSKEELNQLIRSTLEDI